MTDQSSTPSTPSAPASPEAPTQAPASSSTPSAPASPEASPSSPSTPSAPASPETPSFLSFVEDGFARGAVRWQVRGAPEEQLASWEVAGFIEVDRNGPHPIAKLTLKGLAHAFQRSLEEG